MKLFNCCFSRRLLGYEDNVTVRRTQLNVMQSQRRDFVYALHAEAEARADRMCAMPLLHLRCA